MGQELTRDGVVGMRMTMTGAAGGLAVLGVLSLAVGLGLAHAGTASSAPAPVPALAVPAVPAKPVAAVSKAPSAPKVPVTPAVAAPSSPAVAAPSTPAPATVPGIPCTLTTDGDGACVSLSKQRAWLVRDGEVVSSTAITSGRKGHATPTGRFAVEWKDPDHHSKEYDAPMPNSVFFHEGVAFHSGSLQERSHGCIHLSTSAARSFYSTLHVGDPVQVVK